MDWHKCMCIYKYANSSGILGVRSNINKVFIIIYNNGLKKIEMLL